MTEQINFGSKETGDCASVRIYGGADKASVCLYYGSTEMKHYDIYLIPSIFQELWDQIHNIGVGIHKTPREYYNAKIRDVVKQYSMLAKNYVAGEREKILKIVEARKTEEESYEEHRKYIKSLVIDIQKREK